MTQFDKRLTLGHRVWAARRRLRLGRTILRAVIAATAILAPPAQSEPSARWVPADGKPFAETFALPALAGGEVRLAQFRDQVVLVTFWAAWCAPCIGQLRALHKASASLRADGVEILAVNVGEERARVRSFLDKVGATFEFSILLGGDSPIPRRWGVKALPATFVVDKQGRIVYSVLGIEDFTSEAVVSRLKPLIVERPLFDAIPPAVSTTATRSFDPQRVARGQDIYKVYCEDCHGVNAVGTAKWMERNREGRFPPPPLNGTAHAWHHDRDTLRRTILNGTGDLGGDMPAWSGVLSVDDVESVIDWVISLWPDPIYAIWRDRTGQP